ncbi:MAG: glutamine amidotransferase [Magnetospirillum sp.]|nr:glutamine amidotransferase [Magnetospirillum sp.]
MKTCTAIRHVAFEDLDLLEPVLCRRGFSITMIDAPLGGVEDLDPLADDLLVVLGGPIGVYDEADFPFLSAEIELVRRRLEADRPTLGLCLGSQIMARALGARVYPNPNGKEIGWSALTLTDAAEASALYQLGGHPVLHWHGDTFDLPHGAVRLASTPRTANQAFSVGQCGLALQFHVEASIQGLERWYVGHVGEISATPDISVASLRAQAQADGAAMQTIGPTMFSAWLDQVCA